MKNNFRRKFKALFVTLMLAMIVICGFTSQAQTKEQGETFTTENVADPLYVKKHFDQIPRAYEAIIKVPSGISRSAPIIGNYPNKSATCAGFDISSSGQPTIYYYTYDSEGKVFVSKDYVKFNYDVRKSADYLHVAVSNEIVNEKSVYKCYINGELVDTVTSNPYVHNFDIKALQSDMREFSIGCDARNYFYGNIKGFAVYSKALTAEDVKKSYENGTNLEHTDLMACYDFTKERNDARHLKDLSGNGFDGFTPSFLDEKMTFSAANVSDPLYVKNHFEKMPRTYEVEVSMPKQMSSIASLLGNYPNRSGNCTGFDISATGQPTIYYYSFEGTTAISKNYLKFNYDVRGKGLLRLTVTNEIVEGSSVYKLYVDGKLEQTLTGYPYVHNFDIEAAQSNSREFSIGYDAKNYCYGYLRSVAIYSDAISSEAVQKNYNDGVNLSDEGLMAYYDFASHKNTDDFINDETGNGHNCSKDFFERKQEATDYAYSFAVIGDTQKLVYHDAYNGTSFSSYAYDWIVKNKDSKNISFVMGVGDITDKNGTDQTPDDGIDQSGNEWDIAVEQLSKLEKANIPYTLVQGNHDTTAQLDRYFERSANFAGTDMGYYSGTSLGNYYKRFSVGDHKYMVFGLEYGANDDILAWAGNAIEENPEYRVIITTHAYMFRDGTTLDANDLVPPKSSSHPDRNNGDMMWDEFVSKYENIVMVFSGHDPWADVVMRQDNGDNGNVVTQFLIDPQGIDLTYGYKTGMVAMFYVSEDGNRISVEYISAYRTLEAQKEDQNAKDYLFKECNQFDFRLDAIDGEETDYGIINKKYTSLSKYPVHLFDSKNWLSAYSDLGEAIKNVATDYNKQNDYSILIRRDTNMTVLANGLSNFMGTLTIDLNGYAVTTTDAANYLLDLYVDNNSNVALNNEGIDERATFIIKNGTLVKGGGHSLICVNYGNQLVNSVKFNFEFDDVEFISLSSQKTSSALFHGWENGYSSVSAVVKVDAVFNDCVFDMQESVKDAVMLALTYNDKDRVVYNVTVNGGTILADEADDINERFVVLDGNENRREDSLKFSKNNNGEYTELLISNNEAQAFSSVVWNNENGVECIFVKVSESDGYVNYSLYPKVMADYKIKTSITLWSNFVYNIYVPATNFNSATVNGNIAEYTEVEVDGVKYYLIKVDLPAGETLKDIKLTVTLNSGNTNVDANWTLNVYNYIKSVLAGEYDETTKTLMKDMLVYASAAHTYFKNTETVAEKLAEIKTLLGDYNAEMPTGEAKAPADKTYFTDVAVYLGEVPSFRFYLADDYTAEDFTFKVGTRNVEAILSEDGKYLEITMYAYMMLDTVSYTVTDKTTNAEVTEQYNLYSYYDFAKTLNDANLVSVVEGLIKYSASAADYRKSVIAAD